MKTFRSLEITADQLEVIGELAEKADNFLPYTSNPLPVQMRFDALKHGLTELRDALRTIYVNVGGHDPWADSAQQSPAEPT